jgi:hypothetical protein
MENDKIRPLYSEFQGYLSQAPTPANPSDCIYDNYFWDQYNQAVDQLSICTNFNYSRFKIEPTRDDLGGYITISVYRQKLSGLIFRLHGEYFSDEPPLFGNMPSAIITQNQQQSVSVQILLDIQTKIDEVLSKTTDKKERGFLTKFKSILSSLTNVNDILAMCMKLAKEYGLSIQDLISLWS